MGQTSLSQPPVEFNIVVKQNEGSASVELKPGDLQLALDKQIVSATRVLPLRDMPRRVAIVVDASSSGRPTVQVTDAILRQTLEFLKRIHRDGQDRVSLYGFGGAVENVQKETMNLSDLVTSAGRIQFGGGTALFNAVSIAAMRVGDSPDASGILMVISDGDDNQSNVSQGDAIKIAQQRNVIVFTFNNTLSPDGFSQGTGVLRRIAKGTGGLYCHENTPERLATCLKGLEARISSTYRVEMGALTLPRDGKGHKLSVKSVIPALKVEAPEKLYSGGKKK
jgi:hypothetical protein